MLAVSVRPPSDIPFPALAESPGARADENPAAVYLAALADGPGRMRSTLDRIAALACFPNASAVPWQEFRFQRVSAVRAVAAATANKYLGSISITYASPCLALFVGAEERSGSKKEIQENRI